MCEVSSHRHSVYLTDIHQNTLAGFSLCMERVPVAYQRSIVGHAHAKHTGSDIYTTDHNRLPSVDCDTFGLIADVSGIKVWVIPLHMAGESTTFRDCYGGGTGGSRW
jgi:hypothetical protein